MTLTEPMLEYLQLLQKWNKAYNLTAIRDYSEMVQKHLYDSLAILPWIKPKRVLDVGTGPGLPGIPLALAQPSLHITLLDSNGKKIRFLREVKRQLNINNIEIVQTRIEDFSPTELFDTVTSRAFGEVNKLVEYTEKMVQKNGIWLAMKGQVPENELQTLTCAYEVKVYSVPNVVGERCCVIIHKNNNN